MAVALEEEVSEAAFMAVASRAEVSEADSGASASLEAELWLLVVFVVSVWSVDLAGAVDGARAGARAGPDVPAGEVAGAADGDGAGQLRPASPLVWPLLAGTTAMRMQGTQAMINAWSGTATTG
jgi:hypothetical protein